MRKAISLPLMLTLALCQSLLLAQPGVTGVWAVDEGEKVKQNELDHWAKEDSRNTVWDGSRISIFGGRNEVVGFQVIVEAGGSGATGVDVRLDSLEGPGYVITNSGGVGDPMDFVGKRIEIFVESYINVASRSLWGTSWGWVRPLPDEEHMGLLPDALVPVEAPNKLPANGAGGAPFRIGGGRTQGVWIDVYIPPDAPAGIYGGTVRVLENGTVTYRIPVTLQVYGFTLPDSTHFHTMFAYGGLIERHGLNQGSAQWWTLFHKYMNVFHRHRLDLNLGNVTLDEFDARLKGFYTGDNYTGARGYEGPGVGIGNGTYGIGVYDQPDNGWASGFTPNTPAAWQAASNAWEQWFQSNAPAVSRFKYMLDEPSPSAYNLVIDRGMWIRNGAGIGSKLMTYCTARLDPRLFGAVTFWSLMGQSGYDPGDGYPIGYISHLAKQRQALGEKIALYNGTRPGFGVPELLDNVLADNRVNPWIAFKHDIDQYFLWQVGEELIVSPAKNIWVNHYMDWGSPTQKNWGEGTYLYPGEDVEFPSDSRGVAGPIVSMRMKNFRRGMQDYEYLWLARQAGITEDTIAAIINSVVPAALDEVPQNSQPRYAERGYPFERARLRLAKLLAGTSEPEATPGGTFTITPTLVPQSGGLVTLVWTSQGAEKASIDNGVGDVPVSGSLQITVTPPKTFHLQLQNNKAQRTLIAHVNVEASKTTLGENVIRNSGFEDKTDSWSFYTDGSGSFSAVSPGLSGGQAGCVKIVTPGTNTQLYQTDISLTPGLVHRLSFLASSTTGNDIEVSIFQHAPPNADYGVVRQRCDLGRTSRKFSFEFMPQNIATPVSDGRLQFWFASHGAAGDEFLLDEITLQGIGSTFSPVLSAPAFIAPAAGGADCPDVVRLVWRAVDGAESYHVQVSRLGDFSSPIVDEVVADTTLAIGPLESSTTYSRRIRSRGPRGESPFGPVCTFATANFKTSLDRQTTAVTDLVLHQNYPNPFNPRTVIRYSLPVQTHVSLRVFNALGEEVLLLVHGEQPAGTHQVTMDADHLPSGIYFYRLQAMGYLEVKQMTLLR